MKNWVPSYALVNDEELEREYPSETKPITRSVSAGPAGLKAQASTRVLLDEANTFLGGRFIHGMARAGQCARFWIQPSRNTGPSATEKYVPHSRAAAMDELNRVVDPLIRQHMGERLSPPLCPSEDAG